MVGRSAAQSVEPTEQWCHLAPGEPIESFRGLGPDGCPQPSGDVRSWTEVAERHLLGADGEQDKIAGR